MPPYDAPYVGDIFPPETSVLPHAMKRAPFVCTESIIRKTLYEIGFICGTGGNMNLYECPVTALYNMELVYSHVRGIFRGIV